MTPNWKTVPIKEVYHGMYDGPHATPKPSDAGPVFLGIKNVGESGQLDLSEVRHISEEEYPRWVKRVEPRPGDIVFSYEATLNRYALIPQGFRGCLGRRMALVRPDETKVSGRFLFYYFFGREWREVIAKNTLIGSTVDRIPITKFPDFPVKLPPLAIQRKIAAIPSAYDDLIENNLRRIKILEEMAQNLYREWFVKFRFPGHQHARFVDSPLGLIPEGWELVSIRQVARVNEKSIRKGGAPAEIEYIDISSVSPGSVDIIEKLPFADAPTRARRIASHGDIIWSSVRPNRRSFSLIVDPPPNLVVSTGFAVLSAKSVPFTYLYHATTTDDFVSHLVNHAKGAAYPAVNADDFENAKVLRPTDDLLTRFDNQVIPSATLAHGLKRKNANLRQTRDLLLAKLISGELDVSELDIEIKEQAA